VLELTDRNESLRVNVTSADSAIQMTENPYEAPQTYNDPLAPPRDAETVRRELISTETSLKTIGILYYLGGGALLIGGIGALEKPEAMEGVTGLAERAAGGLFIALGIAQFIVGTAVRKLKPWSRIGVGVLSGVGLVVGFPIGTLINAYILFLVFGKKGQMVFSEPYKDVIAATPLVKYKTSKVVVWIILGSILALVIAIIIGG
jgi:hypothetical protein